MNKFKHDIFSSGVGTAASESGRERSGNDFCIVPLEQPALLNGRNKPASRRRFSQEVIVTCINPTEYHEDTGLHESEGPGFESHLESGFMGFDATLDGEQLLDKWCRIQM